MSALVAKLMSALVAKLLILAQTAGLGMVPGVCCRIEQAAAEAPKAERSCCGHALGQHDSLTGECTGGGESQLRCCCQPHPAIVPTWPYFDTDALSSYPLWVSEIIETPRLQTVRPAPWEVPGDWCGPARQARLCVWRL